MKKHFFLMATLCLWMTILSGQNNTSFQQGANQLQTLYSNFEASDTPSGILYGKSLLTFNQNYYSLNHQDPTHSRLSYEILHRSMYDCKSPNNNWLSAPDPFLTNIYKNYEEPSSVVDIVIAAIGYNEIETDGNMDKIHKINNSLEMFNGYELSDVLIEKTAIANMLTKSTSFAGEVIFNLPIQNLQTNLSVDQVKISKDGTNFTPISIGGSHGYTLPEGNSQEIYIQVTIGNDIITSKLLLDVIDEKEFQNQNNSTKNPHNEIFHESLPEDIAGRSMVGEYFGDSTIFATALLSCGSSFSDIQKPFIILDGIDLTWDGNFSDDEGFFDDRLKYSDSKFLEGKYLRDYLIENNFDIVFVDYRDHHISIEENAIAVIDLIEKINAYKQNNGATSKNKMMGFSMGGVVGKWALLEMEENGMDHNVDKYFTFDSPMSGGNISPALQGLIHQLSDILTTEIADNFQLISAITPFLGEAGSALGFITGTDSVLNSPAPEELLFYKYPSGEEEIITTSPTYLEFYNEFKSKGLNQNGHLVHAEYLAIANGSSLGGELSSQELALSELMFQLDFEDPNIFKTPIFQELAELLIEIQQGNINADIMDIFILLSFIADWDIEVEGYALPGKDVSGSQNTIYDGKISIQGNVLEAFDIDIDSEYFAKCSPQLKPLDSAPGGIIDIGSIIGSATGDPNIDIEEVANGIEGVSLQNPFAFCFIPTVSSLNVDKGNSPQNIGHMPMDVNMPIIRDQSPTVNSRWVAVEELPSDPQQNANTEHVALALNNISFIANELSGDYSLINGIDIGQSYNFGRSNSPFSYNPIYIPNNTNSEINNSMSFQSSSSIFVNHEGKIGWIPATFSEYTNQENSHFDLSIIGKSCSLEDYITAEFLDGSKLEIGDESINNTANVYVNLAEIIFRTNSSLTLEKNSNLIINENGTILFDDQVNISMHDESAIELFGTLRTTSDVTINIDGTLILHESAIFDLGGKLTINGVDINDELLKINGKITIEGDIAIKNGIINLGKLGQVHLKATEPWINESVSFENLKIIKNDYDNDLTTALKLENKDLVTIDNLIAQNLTNNTVLEIVNLNKSGNVTLNSLKMHNVRHGVRAINAKFIEITDSDFSSTSVSDDIIAYEWFNGVHIENSDKTLISHTTFTGFGEDNQTDVDEYALSLIDNPIVEIEHSLFEDNYIGIECPETPDGRNNSNLMILSTSLQNNRNAIEMHGFVSDIITIPSSGYLSLECSKILDNYTGIKGENILIQADFTFSNYEMYANSFRCLQKNQGGGTPLIFDIHYTVHNYDEIFLRGNIWEDFDDIGTFINADSELISVVYEPGIDLSQGGSIPATCTTITMQDDNPCIGCLIEDDDNDCTFDFQGEQKLLASSYRNANEALRNKDYALATNRFKPLANLDWSTFTTTTAKCNFMMDVARVFALPSSSSVLDSPISVRKNLENHIFPVPSSDFIKITNLEDCTLRLFSLEGQELLELQYKKGDEIDVSYLDRGLYIIYSEDVKEPMKFVKI